MNKIQIDIWSIVKGKYENHIILKTLFFKTDNLLMGFLNYIEDLRPDCYPYPNLAKNLCRWMQWLSLPFA